MAGPMASAPAAAAATASQRRPLRGADRLTRTVRARSLQPRTAAASAYVRPSHAMSKRASRSAGLHAASAAIIASRRRRPRRAAAAQAFASISKPLVAKGIPRAAGRACGCGSYVARSPGATAAAPRGVLRGGARRAGRSRRPRPHTVDGDVPAGVGIDPRRVLPEELGEGQVTHRGPLGVVVACRVMSARSTMSQHPRHDGQALLIPRGGPRTWRVRRRRPAAGRGRMPRGRAHNRCRRAS